jgi:hypothetical protein
MSTSELYHTQGTKNWNQTGAIKYIGSDVIYSLEPHPRIIRCPCRRNEKVATRGSIQRQIRGVPVGHRKNILFDALIPRVYSPDRDTERQIDLGFARTRSKHTKAFENEVFMRLGEAPIEKVA